MACTGLQPSFRQLLRQAAQTREVAGFLVPALSRRQFSTSITRSSRIGKEPVSIPPEVSLQFIELPRSNARTRNVDAATSSVQIKGPLGMGISHFIPPDTDTTCRRAHRQPPRVCQGDPRRFRPQDQRSSRRPRDQASARHVGNHACTHRQLNSRSE